MKIHIPMAEADIRSNCPKQVRQDDAVAFVQTELQAVMAETYDKLYQDLDARNLIPISSDVPAGATSWAYDSFSKVGRAKMIGSNPSDLPRVDIGKVRKIFPIHEAGAMYAYTRKDLRASAFSGVSLDRERAESVRRAHAELENEILLLGDQGLGLSGLLNNVAIPLMASPGGVWSGLSADAIVDALNAMADQVFIQSKKKFRANMIALPLAQYRLIQTKRLASGNDSTVAKFFVDNYGSPIQIMPLIELDGAGAGGLDRAMAYVMDSRAVKGIIPLPFTQYAPQEVGLEIQIPTEQSHGGTVFHYPVSAVYMDGI